MPSYIPVATTTVVLLHHNLIAIARYIVEVIIVISLMNNSMLFDFLHDVNQHRKEQTWLCKMCIASYPCIDILLYSHDH